MVSPLQIRTPHGCAVDDADLWRGTAANHELRRPDSTPVDAPDQLLRRVEWPAIGGFAQPRVTPGVGSQWFVYHLAAIQILVGRLVFSRSLQLAGHLRRLELLAHRRRAARCVPAVPSPGSGSA